MSVIFVGVEGQWTPKRPEKVVVFQPHEVREDVQRMRPEHPDYIKARVLIELSRPSVGGFDPPPRIPAQLEEDYDDEVLVEDETDLLELCRREFGPDDDDGLHDPSVHIPGCTETIDDAA